MKRKSIKICNYLNKRSNECASEHMFERTAHGAERNGKRVTKKQRNEERIYIVCVQCAVFLLLLLRRIE